MSKRTIALALLIGGALLASAVPQPVAADGEFPFTCSMRTSSRSSKPLVVTTKLSCVGNGVDTTQVSASLIGPATVPFYSGHSINWEEDVAVPVAGIYQLEISASDIGPTGDPVSGTYICCSVQAYGAAAATPTPQPPPPATPPPASTPAPPAPTPKPKPAPPAPTPKPKPAPAATPAPTDTLAETATPSPSPTDTPQPTEMVASAPPSAAPSPSAEVASSPPASPSNSPIPAAASTAGNQDPSGVDPYLLAGAVAGVLAILVLLVILVVLARRRKRHDRSPEPSETVT
jgi:hypothetical protein